MGIITNIESERGLMTIEVDGRAFFKTKKKYLSRFSFAVGGEIDEEAFMGEISEVQFSDAYEAALTMLDYSARTKTEIKNALKRKGFAPGAIDLTLYRLTENRLIDDTAYAKRAAEIKKDKPIGIYALKRQLNAKGLSDEDIEEALSSFDESHQIEAAKTALGKLAPRYEGEDKRAARAKLTAALARRGFSYDTIRAAFDAREDADFDDDFY